MIFLLTLNTSLANILIWGIPPDGLIEWGFWLGGTFDFTNM